MNPSEARLEPQDDAPPSPRRPAEHGIPDEFSESERAFLDELIEPKGPGAGTWTLQLSRHRTAH